ncbi:MAG TPA: hypothetical protein ENI23_05765 [bacterium]|nr:hypothetical protein [bacterium]
MEHKLFEVYKHPAPYRGLKWCFGIPTFGGIKGQLLCYTTKKQAKELASNWEKNYTGAIK